MQVPVFGGRVYGSLSARRAWIEILTDDVSTGGKIVALRKESVDRNSIVSVNIRVYTMSLSARRAWIEILTDDVSTGGKIVALRKESVDRNPGKFVWLAGLIVALRKESVDRNLWWGVRKAVGSLSLSARRAWIEI